jgi:hypothetical protein
MSYKLQNNSRIRYGIIILLSIIGLIACIAILLPQVRQMILTLLEERVFHRPASNLEPWLKALQSYAMGGICFILFFDYCTLTDSGKRLVQKVKQQISDCLSEIDFRSFIKPFLLMSVIYLLGILTIIRANFYHLNDMKRAIEGVHGWYSMSRYISELSSVFIHADINLTDISPLPQLLAVLLLAVSSVLLVYVISNKKITAVRLLATIPLGLSPFFLECLSFKFDAPYMALSVLSAIFPFLFISRKKAFFFSSVAALLVMCMTYQATSGIYLMIVVMLSFQAWNSRKKSVKEILSFIGVAAVAFCSAMIIFKLFFLKPAVGYVVSTSPYPASQLITGSLSNISNYIIYINNNFGAVWKTGIVLIFLFFITKSVNASSWKKAPSFFVSLLVLCIVSILSYGVCSRSLCSSAP